MRSSWPAGPLTRRCRPGPKSNSAAVASAAQSGVVIDAFVTGFAPGEAGARRAGLGKSRAQSAIPGESSQIGDREGAILGPPSPWEWASTRQAPRPVRSKIVHHTICRHHLLNLVGYSQSLNSAGHTLVG